MNKFALVIAPLFFAGTVFGQTGQKPTSKPTTTKPTTTKPSATKPAITAKPATNTGASSLNTLTDSASYAIGISVASFYQQQGIRNLNTTLITKAINDVMAGKPKLMDEQLCNAVMNKVMTRVQEDKSRGAIDSGTAFLARNKERPGVKTTASGLQYEVEREGTGIRPAAIDTFIAHYRGTLLDGTEFDASYNRNEPLRMPVRQVIPGWVEGLQLMPVGSKYKFWIPYNLAYGAMDNGPIPGGSMLIFEVELLDVKKVAE